MADQLQQNDISQFSKGLHLDNSLVDSPKGTTRFALNTVNETELGDSGFMGNEESNEIYTRLTPGFVPIGKCYIGKNETAILSVSTDNSISEIGILDDSGNYTVHVNDSTVSIAKDKLGFKVEQQIQVTYRLRKGCERTIYFTGEGYPPRYFNFDKPDQFRRGTNWSAPKFNLYKKIETFPTIDSIEVLDSSGNLTPGSYTILVQHLDEDLNGTEFYEIVRDINIYNDSLNKPFADIQGSSNITNTDEATKEAQPYKYSKSSKAIKIVLDAVDRNFTYVRFAFAERTSGTGLVSRVRYSDPISVFNPVFTYTGDNASTEGTVEEVELFNLNSGIQTAKHIEQVDNMLILANVAGDQAKVCKLQKYASRIKTDCFVKDIILTSVKEIHNPKNPLVVHNGLSYQPGEIYSMGIMYIFEDYTTSPIFHIPGKSPDAEPTMIYSPSGNVYPMSNVSNQNQSEIYLESSTCNKDSYWGVDSEGISLSNKNVRHHRFPTREEINIGFVKRTNTTGNSITYKRLELTIGGIPRKTDTSAGYTAVDFNIIVRYKRNGNEESFQDGIFPDSNIKPTLLQSNIFLNSDIISEIKLYYQVVGTTTEIEIPLTNNESAEQENGLKYKIANVNVTENNISHVYTVPILGLKFSNVTIPPIDEIGKKVIGYQIVRQERRDVDKTILDSAVIFPMQKSGRNVSSALLAPEFFNNVDLSPSNCEGSEDGTVPTCYNISKRNLMLVTPEHKFMDKTFDSFTSIEQVGTFEREYVGRTATSMQNVYDGTSATGEEDGKTDDDDGFSLRHGYRFTGVKYAKAPINKINITNESVRLYNLEAVNYADTEDGTETLYNLACDNKALILSSTKAGVDLRTYGPNRHQFPYVYLRRSSDTFYQNFRNNPYYLVDNKVFMTDKCQVFGGDTYIAPLRYSNHIFGNAVAALRRKKMSVWALIGSLVIALVGIALAIFSGGSSLVLAGGIIIALGAVATGAATIIETAKFNEIYGDKWQANLDRTVFDFIYARLFVREHPQAQLGDDYDRDIDPWYLSWADDTFRWFGEIVGDLWFETQLNLSLRVPPGNMENNYLKPLKSYMNDNTSQLMSISQAEYVKNNGIGSGRFHRYIDPTVGPTTPEEWYFIRKITTADNSRSGGLKYSGISVPQVYLINPDHFVTRGIKKYYTIPLEYDCCSKCQECFPHRVHYSQQSFQEEKADNYRMFLPNNYRDIEGETGEITNIFRLYNNLYAHTKEALWEMGRNYKERVTDNVVSFIGTGSYFEIPPQKILDDDTGSSAGTRHKWGSIKTPAGYFFISENQRKIYKFTGKSLDAVSDLGLSNWFKENIEVQLDRTFLDTKKEEYPNANNPSNPLGTGFISTYDSRKERVIFSKKDIKLSKQVYQNDTEFCMNGQSVVLFPNISQTIVAQSTAGWSYLGIENCKLKFFKDVLKTRKEKRYITQSVFKDVDYLVFRYNFTTGDGRDLDTRTQLLQPTQSLPLGWCQNNPNTPYISWAGDNTGYGVEAILINIKKIKEDFPNSLEFIFNSKAWWYGERLSGNMNMNAEGYKGGDMILDGANYNFKNVGGVLQGTYSFQTINIADGGRGTCNPNPTNIGNFTYNIESGQLSWDGVSGGEIPVDTIVIEIEVEVNYIEREYSYVDGTTIPLSDFIQNNNSWTMSFSLKNNSWTSWHSYMPNFYINVPEKFYSWKYGNPNIWKHGKLGHYQTFYDVYYPHIIEYTSVENPITTKIWNHIILQTEAKEYNKDLKEYSDLRDYTFNKAIIYNTRQCSGEMDLIVKNRELDGVDYMMNQVVNTNNNHSIIDRTERDWIINDFRDIRIDYTKPIWNASSTSRQSQYYIDKILNESTLDINKDWTQLESFRDKYLVVRLIFDNFADKKLITNFSVENEQMSSH